MAYIRTPVEYDAGTVEQEVHDQLQADHPGLIIPAGSPLDILIRVLAPLWGELRQLLTETLAEIFMYYGEKVVGVPRQLATQASGLADFTVSHTLGYTIPAGTEMTLEAPDGSRAGFFTRLETVIPPGSSTALDVEVLAVEPGAAGSGLMGDAELEIPLADVLSVLISPVTVGGVDAESADGYMDRLAETMPLLAFTLVTASDFELDARNDPQVDRALVIPGYNAATSTPNVGGHFTVAVETSGIDPGAGVRSALQARQQAMVPPNVVVHAIGPTHTTVTVVFAARHHEGWTAADVETRAEQAVLEFLDPARWGLPQIGDQPLWLLAPKVRYTDLVAVLESVTGLDTIVAEGTANTTSGSPNLASVSNPARWVNGQRVTGPGIPAGTRISSGAGTATMVMTANATATASSVAITGAALAVNGNVDDVALAGIAPLPAPSPTTTAAGTVTA